MGMREERPEDGEEGKEKRGKEEKGRRRGEGFVVTMDQTSLWLRIRARVTSRSVVVRLV
jgi:hypothetical protein